MKRFALVLALAASATAPSGAEAVVPPGGKGFIVFASARDFSLTSGGPVIAPNPAENEDQSKIWMLDSESDATPTQITFGATRHSHPAISPDGTRIAYAKADNAGSGPKDIWVLEIATGSEFNLTGSDGGDDPADDEDRPAWSPDGTRIAYAELDDDSLTPNQKNIFIRTVGAASGGPETNFSVSSVLNEDKPVWSPDGTRIYFSAETAPFMSADTNILRKTIGGGTLETVISRAGNDWQPNLSHDGARLCFSQGGFGDSVVHVASATKLNQVGPPDIAQWAPNQPPISFNCVWAGDDSRILYTEGGFSSGRLRSRAFPAAGVITTVANDPDNNDFDGNADWWVDPSPVCAGVSVTVPVNGIVEIPLACADNAGDVDEAIATPPANGVLGSVNNGRVFYTPNVDFRGTDSFTFTGSDQQTTSAPATVTVQVGNQVVTPPDTTRPVIGTVRLSRKTFRRGRSAPRVSARVGTTIGFDLSEAAGVVITFRRAVRGRRVGKRCRAVSRRNAKRKRCTRYIRSGFVRFSGKQGANRLAFAGKVNDVKRLKLGRYRLTVAATDAAGNKARSRTAKMRIVRR